MSEELENLKKGLRWEMKALTRADASFEFELPEVSKFFEINNERYSETFWCRGVEWSLKVTAELHPKDGKFLGFFLNCHNEDWDEWSYKVDYWLILFNNPPGEDNFGKSKTIFNQAGTHGFRRFITYRKLFYETKYYIGDEDPIEKTYGYVQNDSLRLGARLKVEVVESD